MEIFVRAWDKEDRTMVYSDNTDGSYRFGMDSNGALKCYANSNYCDAFGEEHDEWEELDNIMLGSKAKDIEDKRVYDGDFVEITYYTYEEPQCSAIFEVIKDDFGFDLKFISGDIYEDPYTETWRVVGNRYENSEILH